MNVFSVAVHIFEHNRLFLLALVQLYTKCWDSYRTSCGVSSQNKWMLQQRGAHQTRWTPELRWSKADSKHLPMISNQTLSALQEQLLYFSPVSLMQHYTWLSQARQKHTENTQTWKYTHNQKAAGLQTRPLSYRVVYACQNILFECLCA